ncbi:MAG: SCO7613 C-terminal domain-containing membrane protein, partial [Thermomicrobiales bacterium]
VYTSLVVLPFSTLAGIGAISTGTIWFLPASLAAATITTGSLAYRSRSSIFSGLCSLMAIGTIAGVLVATERSPLDWALVAIGLAFLLILIGERGPMLARAFATRALLHIEAIALLLGAPLLALLAERDWLLSLSLVLGVIGSALIARLRQERWLLLLSSSLAVAAYATIALYGDVESTSLRQILFQMPLPLLLAAVACGLDRKTSGNPGNRSSWGIPIWIIAAVTALGITISPPVSLATSHGQITAAVIATVFAAGSLLAAWSLRMPLVRVAYGVWKLYAAGLLIESSPFNQTDQTALSLISGLFLISGSIIWATRIGVPFTTLRAYVIRLPELGPFLISTLLSLLGVIAITIVYIVDDTSSFDNAPSVRWTWASYLAIHVGISLLAGSIGYRMRHRTPEPIEISAAASEDDEVTGEEARRPAITSIIHFMPEISLFFGLIAAMLALRIATNDLVIWSWVGVGIGIASILTALSQLGQQRPPATDFSRRFLNRTEIVGFAIGAIAILGNLTLVVETDRDVNNWVQVALYTIIGLLLFVTGMAKARPQFTFGSITALTLAVAFGGRAFGADRFTLGLMILIFAWVITGTSLVLPSTASGRWRGQQAVWRYSAFALPLVTMLLTILSDESVRAGTRGWQVIVLSVLSLAGMLAIDAWRRQDAIRGIAASALAMIALLMEIAVREPANIQVYTVPLALYLLGLSWTQRKQTTLRDMLLGAGAAVLIVPTLLQAMNFGGFNWLLLAGGEALALFLVGLVLRLRVLIAAGIIAISLIVLRMLVDAVNAMPSWMILLVVGLLLLAGGTVMVVWKEALRTRIDSLRLRWRAMG